jgi:hypothetical protein
MEQGINKVSRTRIVVNRERKGAIEYEFEDPVDSQFSSRIGFGSGDLGEGKRIGLGICVSSAEFVDLAGCDLLWGIDEREIEFRSY